MLVPMSVLLSVAMVVTVDGGDSNVPDCSNSPSVSQRYASDLECPAQAVCADEWNTIRDWYNGTRCRDQRLFLHCSCPGQRRCPVGDPAHAFYANKKHTQYLCEPRCDMEKCSTRFRPAMEMVQHSREFNRHNFYRINCRCRGHHFPLSSRPGRLVRTTSYMRVRFNFTTGVVHTQYRCSPYVAMLEDDDPCE